MIFQSLFGSRGKTSLCAIIEIQSGLVRGSLIDFGSSTLSKAHSSFEYIPHRQRFVTGHLGRPIISALRKIAEKLTKEASGHKIQQVHLVLTSPWIISQIKKSNIVFDIPTHLSSQNIKGFLSAGVAETRSDLKRNFDAVIVEQKLFEITMNGYPIQPDDFTKTSKSKKAERLGLTYAVSATSSKVMNDFQSAIDSAFHIDNIATHSSALLQYAGIRNSMPDTHSYLSIHCHRELTDLIMVRNGNCEFVGSIPYGTDTFIEKLAEALCLSVDTASAKISLYCSSSLSKSETEKTKNALDIITKKWYDSCIKSIRKEQEHVTIPSVIVLSADNHFDLIENALASETSSEIIPFQKMSGDVDMYAEVIFQASLVQ